jgi:hypothetical protein
MVFLETIFSAASLLGYTIFLYDGISGIVPMLFVFDMGVYVIERIRSK